jgi:ketosteroid isomerase-like protein
MTRACRFKLARKCAVQVTVVAFAAIALPAVAHDEPHRLPAIMPSLAPTTKAAATTPVATVDAFHTALASGNTRAALDLLAEDVLIFKSGGVERSRAEYASHHLAADAAYSAAVRRTLITRSHGETGDAACVTSVDLRHRPDALASAFAGYHLGGWLIADQEQIE